MKPFHFCGKRWYHQSISSQIYIIGDVGQLWLLELGSRNIFVHPQVPFLDGLVLADRVELVLILQLDGGDAVGMSFEVDTFLDLSQIPGLDGAVVPARKHPSLRRAKLYHPYAGLVLTDGRSLMVRPVLWDLCQFYLHHRTATFKSLEQVTRDL